VLAGHTIVIGVQLMDVSYTLRYAIVKTCLSMGLKAEVIAVVDIARAVTDN